MTVHTRALIIGTGFSGLGMGIALQQQGVDFLILEKADEVGGTWRDNTYPGAACDVPSHLYSFSFEPKPDWRYVFSYQPEILDYLKGVTDQVRAAPLHQVQLPCDAGALGRRRVPLARLHRVGGRSTSRSFVISGAGALHIPSLPDIPGLDDFARPGLPHRAVGPRRRPDRASGWR